MGYQLREEGRRRLSQEVVESQGRLHFLVDGRAVGEYAFHGDDDRSEGARPYFESLRTLGGLLATDFRPSDHRWHGPAPFFAEELSLDPGEDFACSVALVSCDGPLDGDAAQRLSDETRRHLVALEKE